MLFDSIDFKAMESSLGALSQKQQIIAQNLANQDTPNYKAKTLSFDSVLDGNMTDGDNHYTFKTTVTTDDSTYVNEDGNNVDSDKESLELYDSYIQSAYIVQKMNTAISTFRYVVSQSQFK
ncbi:MAG: flagellar basal body rod protein FlgB [Oscillospiraceae bacterium]